MNATSISIGSRGSALALVQARLVAAALEREGRGTRIVIIETDGDRRAPDTAWGEGAFVAAIERALLDRRIDVAVHSAKDVPIDGDERLRIAAYLPRADPRDALVVRHDAMERSLEDLRPGARVGTDSPRRAGFVLAQRPDLVVHPLHGNVDTRLRRLDDGETDALVLACAGLDRLSLSARIAERLEPDLVPPAPGQGAIAVQIRRDDARMLGLAAAIDDTRTRSAVETERAFLEASGGGCRAPIGALATISGTTVDLLAGRANPDGTVAVFGRRRGATDGGRDLAMALADELRPERRRPEPTRANGIGTPAEAGRVLVTRAHEQAGDLMSSLRGVGLEPILVPAIAIEFAPPGGGLDQAARTLDRYQWVIVTSENGARAVLGAAKREAVVSGGMRWAAIGGSTAAVLERAGIDVDFVPNHSSGVAIAGGLPLDTGDRVLVVRSDLAGTDLVDGIRRRGNAVDDVIAYRTLEAPARSRPLLRAAVTGGALGAVVFTSGSTIRGLRALAVVAGVDVTSIPAVCIGPETATEAGRAGFVVLAISPKPDAATLARTTAEALSRRSREVH